MKKKAILSSLFLASALTFGTLVTANQKNIDKLDAAIGEKGLPVTLDFTSAKNVQFPNWGGYKAYDLYFEADGTSVAKAGTNVEYTVHFSYAMKQSSTITNMPVSSSGGYVTVESKSHYIYSLTTTVKQWTSRVHNLTLEETIDGVKVPNYINVKSGSNLTGTRIFETKSQKAKITTDGNKQIGYEKMVITPSTLEVVDVPLTGFAVTGQNHLAKGMEIKLKATKIPADSTHELPSATFKALTSNITVKQNGNVATVTAKNDGVAKIEVTCGQLEKVIWEVEIKNDTILDAHKAIDEDRLGEYFKISGVYSGVKYDHDNYRSIQVGNNALFIRSYEWKSLQNLKVGNTITALGQLKYDDYKGIYYINAYKGDLTLDDASIKAINTVDLNKNPELLSLKNNGLSIKGQFVVSEAKIALDSEDTTGNTYASFNPKLTLKGTDKTLEVYVKGTNLGTKGNETNEYKFWNLALNNTVNYKGILGAHSTHVQLVYGEYIDFSTDNIEALISALKMDTITHNPNDKTDTTACIDAWPEVVKAKKAMTELDNLIYQNDTEYDNAKARYDAWALRNPEGGNGSSDLLTNSDSGIVIIISVSVLTVALLGAAVLLMKRRKVNE